MPVVTQETKIQQELRSPSGRSISNEELDFSQKFYLTNGKVNI